MNYTKTEIKAYKKISELRGQIIDRLIHEARTKIQYCKDKPEEILKLAEMISNPDKWEYYGLIKKEDLKVLETLETLTNDNLDEINYYHYKEWTPPKYD